MRGPVLGGALLALGAMLLGAPGANSALGSAVSAREHSSRPARAEALYGTASARLGAGTIDERRTALRELEEAVLLAPDVARYQSALGRAYLDGGFTTRARARFRRAAALAPGDAAPRLGLGQACKREWLLTVDPASLTDAIAHLLAAVRLDPALCDAWVLLAPLLYERGRLSEACAVADQACTARGDCAEAQLAAAYLSYRSGRIARAESLFAVALPRLPLELKAHFDDLTPLLTPEDGDALAEMSQRMRGEFVRRFWSEADPDPTTPENEAQLEYWSRVAHTCLVFLDPGEPRWDMRAELYVRYGAPQSVDYEALGVPLANRQTKFETFGYDGYGGIHRIGEPMWYPLHVESWDYSDLGMRVLLQDFGLSNNYRLPVGRYRSEDPVPDARALERSDLLATAAGRAIFPVLPPGVHPLPVQGHIARFESAHGNKLLAQIEAPGTPVDSLWAQCVVVDSSEHEIARLARTLSPSGCDPTTLRTADFTFEVPPGVYRVALSVRDEHGARGVARVSEQVGPVPAALAMSDVVVTCGPLDLVRSQPEVRLGPNLRSRVSGDGPLIAYFEIYRLAPGTDGQSRFEYECTVRSEERDPRSWYRRLLPFGAREPQYLVRSEDVNQGPLRRQFLAVPVQSLRPGHYRLDVRVRDLTTGTSTTGSARFERAGEAKGGA